MGDAPKPEEPAAPPPAQAEQPGDDGLSMGRTVSGGLIEGIPVLGPLLRRGTEKAAAARTAGKATATMANYRILRISRTGGAIPAEEDVVISRPEAEVVAVLVVWQVAVKLAEGGRHPWIICLLLPNLASSRE